MIDWEEISGAENEDELKAAKLWLFQENIRLEKEQKRLKEKNLFFEQKLAILQEGFRQLEEDRKCLDREKQLFIREQLSRKEDSRSPARGSQSEMESQVAETLFRNADNPLALRKRYRDLVKIFHPDNLFGDAELARQINREFARRREREN